MSLQASDTLRSRWSFVWSTCWGGSCWRHRRTSTRWGGSWCWSWSARRATTWHCATGARGPDHPCASAMTSILFNWSDFIAVEYLGHRSSIKSITNRARWFATLLLLVTHFRVIFMPPIKRYVLVTHKYDLRSFVIVFKLSYYLVL